MINGSRMKPTQKDVININITYSVISTDRVC